MKPNKSDIMKWINALRSGEYKQANGALQNEYGYCCLGVLCEIASPDHCRPDGIMLGGGYPAIDYGDPPWVSEINKGFFDLAGVRLSGLNDVGYRFHSENLERFTFDEIADLLQAVYIEEVLD